MSTKTAKPSATQRASSGGSFFSRITFGIFLFIIVGAVGVLILLIFGRCSGEEFSSADFTRRTFYYFRIPVVKLQVTPLVRHDKSSVLVDHLHRHQLIPKGLKKNWKLASHRVGSGHPYEADELILTRYLEQRNNGYNLRWLNWSQNNPRLARAFWPILWRVANEDLYVLVPELFQLSRYTPDPVTLDTRMRALIVKDGARIAAGEYQLGNYQRAAQVSAFVIATVPSGLDSAHNALEKDLAIAIEIQSQAIEKGAQPVESVPLALFDPNAPEPEVKGEQRDETEPVEPTKEDTGALEKNTEDAKTPSTLQGESSDDP